MQQIGLSVPVIIIKQEEACQCQCACRDSAKDKASSRKQNCSSQGSKASGEPPAAAPAPPPQPFPINLAASTSSAAVAAVGAATTLSSTLPPCEQSTLAGNPSDSQNHSLSAMDVSDFLSLQSPEASASASSPLIPIEALLQGEEELALGGGRGGSFLK